MRPGTTVRPRRSTTFTPGGRIAADGRDPAVADRDRRGDRVARIHRVDAPVRQHDILQRCAGRRRGLRRLRDLRACGVRRSGRERDGRARGGSQKLPAGVLHVSSLLIPRFDD